MTCSAEYAGQRSDSFSSLIGAVLEGGEQLLESL